MNVVLRRRLWIAIRIALLTALLVLFWLRGPTLTQVLGEMRAVPLAAFALAMLLYCLVLVGSAARLRVLSRAAGSDIGLIETVGLIFKSSALNSFTVSGAGEAYKVARLNRGVGRLPTMIAMVLGERLIGVAALIGLAGLAALERGLRIGVGFELWLLAAAGAIAIALLILFRRQRFVAKMLGALAQITAILTRPRVLLPVLIFTLFILAMQITSAMALGHGLHIELPWQAWSFVVPLVTIVGMMPLTFGGIGVREGGYVLLLGQFGIPPGPAIALGLLQYGLIVLACLIGALWLAARPAQFKETTADG